MKLYRMMKSDITIILIKWFPNFIYIFHFQHFLGKNQVVKGMFVVKEDRRTVLLHFPKIFPSQVLKIFWEYICGSSQNTRRFLKISAESVKYTGGGVYFLLNLTALMHATSHTKTNCFADTFKVLWHSRVAFGKTSIFV